MEDAVFAELVDAAKRVDEVLSKVHDASAREQAIAQLKAIMARHSVTGVSLETEGRPTRDGDVPPCHVCGKPATTVACDVLEVTKDGSIDGQPDAFRRYVPGLKRAGCDEHPA
jgi:hypothetical protein